MKIKLFRSFRARLKNGYLFIIAVMLLLVSGCGNGDTSSAPATEYSFTQTNLRYSEMNSQFSFSKDVLCTETAFARYCFEATVDKAQQSACIVATDKILALLEVEETRPDIYVFSENTFDGTNIIGNTLYTRAADWESVEYATDIILTVYGEGCHYGLAFGYADMLCEKLGWETYSGSSSAVPELADIMDLNLLCFDDRFASEADIAAARTLSCAFAEAFSKANGPDALCDLLSLSGTQAGMETLSSALEAFYSENGIEYSPATLRFAYGGVSYDYAVFTEFASFYVGTDWTDSNEAANPLVSENFLHENYAETKEFFERNILQMDSYQNLFALPDYDNDLVIALPNSKNGSQYSYYRSDRHMIVLFNVDSLMHEYIHSLTKPDPTQEQWETEGFARFFSYYFDHYSIAFLNVDYNNATESDATRYIYEYKASLDRPIDISCDFREIENIAVYSRGYTDPNASYVSGSSFVQFLVGLYGEASVVDYIYGNGIELPMSYDDLVDEWNQYINDNYSGFSRYGK